VIIGIVIGYSCVKKDNPYTGFPTTTHIHAKIEGFEVQEILKGEGEFLSICTDPQGRFLVSPRQGFLHRINIHNKAKEKLHIDTLDVGVVDCQGLLYAYQHLYMMGTGPDGIRGVYRLKDQDGQGNYGKPFLMKEFPSNGDHSGHTLTLGPDGMIYFLTGNNNAAPTGENVKYVNASWHQDRLNPVTSAYGANQKPPGGYVMRTDSVGNQWEFFAYGLRNPYDMCFSPAGELFTFDSDNEWDVGLPWYRPIRVNHLVSGGDYAWRQSTAKRFDYYPDVWPSIVDLERGSPTATCFGTGAAFPSKYQQALLLGDWSYGKIYALHLNPDGATYEGAYETLISGQPLNITDMVVGQDGAVYFVTGGNGTDTGLFRIIYKGEADTQPVSPPSDKGEELRAIRKALEAYHFSDDPKGLPLALQHIDHDDRFIRNAARVILERHDPTKWANALEKDPSTFKRQIALLTALIRTDTTHTFTAVIQNHLGQYDLSQLTEEQQLHIIRLYEILFSRLDRPVTTLIQQAYQQLMTTYPAESPAVNKEASHVLGYLCSKKSDNQAFISTTLSLLEQTDSAPQFIHYLGALRNVDSDWTQAQRLTYRYWLTYGQDNLRGGSLLSHYLGAFEMNFEQSLKPTEKQLLASVEPSPLDPSSQGPVPPRPKPTQSSMQTSAFVYDWQIEDLNTSLELVTSPRNDVERDFNRGRQMFKKGNCITCHYMHDQGGNIGPDLTTAGNSFGVEELLNAIINPSQAISSRFQSTKFTLQTGDVIHGRIITENDENYVVQTGIDPSQSQEIFKTDIAQTEQSQISSMPSDLINPMNREEVLDLLYYITEVAKRSKMESAVAIHEDQTVFEQGDSSLIELIDYSGEGDIYYTLDGTEPNQQSNRYKQPFFVRKSSLIKAVSITNTHISEVQTQVIHAIDKNQNGLNWHLFRNMEPGLPDVSDLEPDASGISYRINVNNIAEGENKFLLHFEGEIQIDQPGTYTFFTLQDDFVRLSIDDQLVVESMQKWFDGEKQGEIDLSKGRHKIRVAFYDHLATEYISVSWEGPNIPKQEIPGHVLFRDRNTVLSAVE